MKNRRQSDRVRKRLHVEYGEDALDQQAIATDISLGGLYLQARRHYPLGTRLHLHIVEKDGPHFYAEAEVMRLNKTDPRLAQVAPPGMGLRFIPAEEIVRGMIPKESRHMEIYPVLMRTREDVMKLMAEQLSAGMLLAKCDAPPPTSNAIVEFTVELEFRSPTVEVHGTGRVIQQLKIGDADHVVLEIRDRADLLAKLEAALL